MGEEERYLETKGGERELEREREIERERERVGSGKRREDTET